MFRLRFCPWIAVLATWLALPSIADAAPSVADALKLKPVQQGVEYDTPGAAQLKGSTIKAEKINGSTAWVIRMANGDILRQFSDSDSDNVVDTWSYFQNGLEVYRDVDANFNGKADEYRWFHGAGMRWGIDRDEDGKIDHWKLISAEEVAEEVAEAVRTKDRARFQRLLLSAKDIKGLGLSDVQSKQLAARVKGATATFDELAKNGDLGDDQEFRDFGGLKPGMVPEGTRGAKKDIMVYENVWAMVRSGEKFEQLQLGTMVNVKGAWKLVDGPTLGNSGQVAGGFFFVPGEGGGPGMGAAPLVGGEPTEKMQEILSDLQELDTEIMRASAKQKPALNSKRAGMLLQLASVSATPAEGAQWLRQLADMVSAATQDGTFKNGVAYLEKMEEKLAKEGQSKDLLAYFEFQRMLAKYYGETLTNPDTNPAEAHEAWLEELEAYVEKYPSSDNCAEALRQLAWGGEISGNDKDALAWYRQILDDHPQSIHAPTAKGAVIRLTSVGRPIQLKGSAIQGGGVDLTKLRGKAVVVQYWTSTSDVCKADHAVLGNLYKKFGGGRGLEIVGVNLDYSREELLAYLKENRLPWPQLYEKGGFESRYAQEMGIVTVPMMILLGPDGNVVSNNIQAAEIEDALAKLQKK